MPFLIRECFPHTIALTVLFSAERAPLGRNDVSPGSETAAGLYLEAGRIFKCVLGLDGLD